MKKGFTLIELLAVIVILAIIALIATPIVLSIIEETKESATLRSAEYYLSAVENSIMKKNLSAGGSFSPNVCEVQSNGNLLCDGKDTLEVEVNGEVPSSGTITFNKGKIIDATLTLSNKTITKDTNGKLVLGEAQEKTICKLIDDADGSDTITPGDKYQCKVKDDMEEEWKDGYYFYVLSSEEDGTTNLIMDRNINSDGTPTTKAIKESEKDSNGGIYNLVAWISKLDYNDDTNFGSYGNNNKGPITAMNFLYNATKDWTNIPALNYTYNDREYQGTTAEDRSYTSFVSNNGVATITALAGNKTTIGTSDNPLRARMPIYSRTYDEDWNIIAEKGEVSNLKSNESNKYLYYHMGFYCYDNEDDHNLVACEDAGFIEGVYEKGIENIDGINGYWTLSSDADYSTSALHVYYVGDVDNGGVDYEHGLGARPVINLKI